MGLFRSAAVVAAIAVAGVGAWSVYSGRVPAPLEPVAARFGFASKTAAAESRPARQGNPPVAVVTATAEKADFPIRFRTIGLAEPLATVAIKARVDSQIVEQKVKDGQDVKAGDIMFILDDRELRAQVSKDEAALARDQALLERTQADLARKRDLASRGAAAPQQMDQAVADEAAARATVQNDQAMLSLDKVRLDYSVIRAPISGRVGTVQVTPGNLVKNNDANPLATITQITPIRVTFPMSERELPAVRDALNAGNPPEVRTFLSGKTDPLAVGKVAFLDSQVDVNSGTITVKAVFDNANEALWPGQFLDVDVVVGHVDDASVVPTVAVQPGQNGPYVFLVKPDNTVAIRPVSVAATIENRTALSSGIAPGDRVVVDGQMRLVDGARVVEQRKPVAQAAPPQAGQTREAAR